VNTHHPLAGRRILIVEDEPFIAFDLKMAIEDVGAVPIGPAATVAEALDFLTTENPDGAILDVNLPDGTIDPVLDALPRDVSAVVHTGVGLAPDVRARHPRIPVFFKPSDPAVLLRRLADGLGPKPS
jgi:CheY-like chemotaxis protein